MVPLASFCWSLLPSRWPSQAGLRQSKAWWLSDALSLSLDPFLLQGSDLKTETADQLMQGSLLWFICHQLLTSPNAGLQVSQVGDSHWSSLFSRCGRLGQKASHFFPLAYQLSILKTLFTVFLFNSTNLLIAGGGWWTKCCNMVFLPFSFCNSCVVV